MSWQPDLHLHTTASDGRHSPAEIGLMAKAAQVNLIALTDHDTLLGFQDYTPVKGVTVIGGVEVSAVLPDNDVHILLYGANPANGQLQAYLDSLHVKRVERAEQIVKRLCLAGLEMSYMDLAVTKSTAVGRMHVARALVRKGYAGDVKEAFKKYLVRGKPGYVARELPSPGEVIRFARDEGMVPVLAHPGRLAVDRITLERLLDTWQAAGLMGVEVYHPANRELGFYDRITRNRGLLVTGGSDYHGDHEHGAIGQMVPKWQRADWDSEKLLESIPMR